MRYVKKDLKAVPASLSTGKIDEIANGNTALIDDKVFKGSYTDAEGRTQSKVREELNKYYFTKCAYCEMHCKGEIEHYRPKLGVTGTKHVGYYWLCYEWTNLVPSCRYCNTEGGKGNQFPIISKTRISKPVIKAKKLDQTKCLAHDKPLISEQPYLLHPEIDDPKKFLNFSLKKDKKGVEIKGKDKAKRGSQTIKICNLNREYLQLNRLETVYYTTKQRFNIVFDLVSQGTIDKKDIAKALKPVFKQLEDEIKDEKLLHTLLRWFIISNEKAFETVFAPYIENDEQRGFMIDAFKQYKTGTL